MTCEFFPPPLYKFKPEANKQVVYLSGPHGVGKSTLIEDLKSFDRERVVEQIAHMESLTDNISRQLWRNSLHCVEHRENLAYAMSQSPKSVVIGDRCFLDDRAYCAACAKLGWISQQDKDNIARHADLTYEISNTPKPENFIILLPPYDWNMARIEERWAEGIPAKWCERNFHYLGVVREQFTEFAQQLGNRAVVVDETDRKGRVKKIKNWLNDHDLEDFIVEGRTYVEGVRSSWGS